MTFRFRGIRKDGSAFPAETDMIPLTFGGHTYAWSSPVVLGLFAGSAVGLVAYVVSERYASDPVTSYPRFASSSAMPLIPIPPTPTK